MSRDFRTQPKGLIQNGLKWISKKQTVSRSPTSPSRVHAAMHAVPAPTEARGEPHHNVEKVRLGSRHSSTKPFAVGAGRPILHVNFPGLAGDDGKLCRWVVQVIFETTVLFINVVVATANYFLGAGNQALWNGTKNILLCAPAPVMGNARRFPSQHLVQAKTQGTANKKNNVRYTLMLESFFPSRRVARESRDSHYFSFPSLSCFRATSSPI
mmetsp:Transcript_43048/g.168518  ORF Transcript_43048/g.168518 Transcript_43048/m.168518 type:complete len:212 (-) Transcript_43048:145-780(-)